MPPEEFSRAIVDLDRGAMGEARNHILNEIRLHPQIDPNRIVEKINRVENEPGHAHRDVALVNRGGYLDIQPVNYGPQPGYGPQSYYQPRENVVPAVVGGVAAGVVIDELLHRHRR